MAFPTGIQPLGGGLFELGTAIKGFEQDDERLNLFRQRLNEDITQHRLGLAADEENASLGRLDNVNSLLRAELKNQAAAAETGGTGNQGQIKILREQAAGEMVTINTLRIMQGKPPLEINLGEFGNPAAIQKGEETIATETAKASVVNPRDEANRMAQMASSLVEKGFDGEQIAEVLNTAATTPELLRVAAAIAGAVPLPAQVGAREGQQDVARAGQTVKALTDLGVDPQLAGILALGRSGASVALQQPGPSTLSDVEMRDLRGELQVIQTARGALQDVVPLINEQSVGVFGALNEQYGGITSQLPGLREIGNAIGVFDEATVNQAITARNAFRTAIEFVKPFATRKDSRLSNQDREFIARLTGFLDVRQSAETVKGTAQRLLGIMQKLEAEVGRTLQSGQVALPSGGAAAATAIPEGFEEAGRTPDGKVIIRNKATGEKFMQE